MLRFLDYQFNNNNNLINLSLYVFGLISFFALSISAYNDSSFISTLLITIILIFLGGLIIFCESENKNTYLLLTKLFLFAFFIRSIFTAFSHIWLIAVNPEPVFHWGGNVGGDEYNFYNDSKIFVDDFKSLKAPSERYIDYIYTHHIDLTGWIYLLGIIRYGLEIFTENTLLGLKILNTFFSSLVVVYTYLLARLVSNNKTAILSGIIILIFPDFIYYGASLHRDVLVSLTILIFFFYLFDMIKNQKLSLLKVFIISLILYGSFIFKTYLNVFLSILTILIFIHYLLLRTNHKTILVLLTSVLFLPFIILFFDYFYNHISFFLFGNADLLRTGIIEQVSVWINSGFTNETGSLSGQLNQFGSLMYIPINVMQYFIFIPFWHPFSSFGINPRTIMEVICVLISYGYLIFLPSGLWKSIKNYKNDLVIYMIYISFSFILFLSIANAVKLRWRLYAMPFLIIIIAYGLLSDKEKYLAFLFAFFIIIMYVLYGILKFNLSI